jgi:hypothetical protein
MFLLKEAHLLFIIYVPGKMLSHGVGYVHARACPNFNYRRARGQATEILTKSQ